MIPTNDFTEVPTRSRSEIKTPLQPAQMFCKCEPKRMTPDGLDWQRWTGGVRDPPWCLAGPISVLQEVLIHPGFPTNHTRDRIKSVTSHQGILTSTGTIISTTTPIVTAIGAFNILRHGYRSTCLSLLNRLFSNTGGEIL